MALIDLRGHPSGSTPKATLEAVADLPASRRDAWMDNARFLAATLVVLDHFLLEVSERSGTAFAIWTGTWAFRIPVYVLLAGWFSSADPLTPARATKLLRNIVLVYLVFDLLLTVQREFNTGLAVYDPFTPEFGLWFLLSLACWRVVLPLVAHVPHLFWWATGLAVAIGVAPSITGALSLGRTFALFPLFVLGWRLRQSDVRDRFTSSRARLVALVVALGVMTALFLAPRVFDSVTMGDFVLKWNYKGPWLNQVVDAGVRLSLLALAVAGALALLALIPRRRLPFITYLGAGSMYIYLLHLFVVQQLDAGGYFATVNSRGELLLMMAGAVGLAVLLASPPVRRLTRPLVQPRSVGLPAPLKALCARIRPSRPAEPRRVR